MPHRALKVLVGVGEWMSEEDVWSRAKVTEKERFYESLNQLVKHAYAVRRGERGAYEWRATFAGVKRARPMQPGGSLAVDLLAASTAKGAK